MVKGMNTTRSGFTLIELIIVLAIIGILLGLAIPQYQTAARRAREAVLKENLFILRKLINQYHLDKGKYPPSLQALVEEGYLRTIPIDPMTKSSETWVEVREEFTEELIQAGLQPGVVDVFSGSKEIGLDGTPYNTW
ncbi:MAG: hypothetical protein B5M54_07730 [Candidatus Aminicenantes bacterium 4484_214]|nr:MAG: hypothetical protein B5M54_07730 [Candidatus Aminicenantes bacterium 4484_214]